MKSFDKANQRTEELCEPVPNGKPPIIQDKNYKEK